jgi:hypothetical protein
MQKTIDIIDAFWARCTHGKEKLPDQDHDVDILGAELAETFMKVSLFARTSTLYTNFYIAKEESLLFVGGTGHLNDEGIDYVSRIKEIIFAQTEEQYVKAVEAAIISQGEYAKLASELYHDYEELMAHSHNVSAAVWEKISQYTVTNKFCFPAARTVERMFEKIRYLTYVTPQQIDTSYNSLAIKFQDGKVFVQESISKRWLFFKEKTSVEMGRA